MSDLSLQSLRIVVPPVPIEGSSAGGRREEQLRSQRWYPGSSLTCTIVSTFDTYPNSLTKGSGGYLDGCLLLLRLRK